MNFNKLNNVNDNVRITKPDAIEIKKALKKSLLSLNNDERRYINLFLGVIAVSGEMRAYEIINEFK